MGSVSTLPEVKHASRRLISVSGLVVAVILGLVALLAAGCQSEQKAMSTVDTGGRLQVAETSYDFGAVPVGQEVKHDFMLKNNGTGPLDLGQMSVKRLEGC